MPLFCHAAAIAAMLSFFMPLMLILLRQLRCRHYAADAISATLLMLFATPPPCHYFSLTLIRPAAADRYFADTPML